MEALTRAAPSNAIQLKCVLAGTLLGLFGPGILLLVVSLRFGVGPVEALPLVLLFWFGLWGFFACLAAGIGVAAACATMGTKWMYWLLSTVLHLIVLSVFLFPASLGRELEAWLGTGGLIANSWLSGWYATRLVQKAMTQPERILPDMERVALAHFESSTAKRDTNAIRFLPQEMTEHPGIQ